jgi:hypothetical protein
VVASSIGEDELNGNITLRESFAELVTYDPQPSAIVWW